MHHTASNDAEEVVVPSATALIAILLTGLLYLVLPENLTIGPNWLLLLVEVVFVVPLVIDVLTAWHLPLTNCGPAVVLQYPGLRPVVLGS